MRLALALLLAGCAAGEPIVAAEGGVARSADGVFEIVFPPDALLDDTVVEIEALSPDEWPVDAPGRFELIGRVYRVRPAGLVLRNDAYAVVHPPEPGRLAGADGDLLAVHYTWSPNDEKVRPAARTRTFHLADGRTIVVGTLYELGTHWVGDRVPGVDRALPLLRLRIDGDAGAHATGEEWRASELALAADMPHTLFSRAVTSAVVGPLGVGPAPLEDGGSVARWDATAHREHGLHPFEVLRPEYGAREEVRATRQEPAPVELDPATPLNPVIDPLPGWTCAAASDGEASLFVGVDVVTGASDGVVTVGSARELGPARCD